MTKKMDNLARNAMLARQAGMSYGKWKAMQDPVKITPKERHYCLNCGSELFPKTSKVPKYCDYQCGNEYRERKYRERAAQEKL